MRIVFIGTVQFSEKALAKLIDMKADVIGVCTLER
jgi:methionyl-tRNA formyltransferase|tara:strand:- start:374 stop:478 length:105 start_codon:yes stop_codon:yes gene_type:complete